MKSRRERRRSLREDRKLLGLTGDEFYFGQVLTGDEAIRQGADALRRAAPSVSDGIRVAPEDARLLLMRVLDIDKRAARELLRGATNDGRIELTWNGLLGIKRGKGE